MIKIRPTDALFSNIVRSRAGWKCERCGGQYEPPTKALHCSHYHGRSHENTRFDFENCNALCYGCHAYFHANPLEHTEWKKKQLGEKAFKNLLIRANTYRKRDDKLIKIYLNSIK